MRSRGFSVLFVFVRLVAGRQLFLFFKIRRRPCSTARLQTATEQCSGDPDWHHFAETREFRGGPRIAEKVVAHGLKTVLALS
jgi:hypothetical protein